MPRKSRFVTSWLHTMKTSRWTKCKNDPFFSEELNMTFFSALIAFMPPWSTPWHQHRRSSEWWEKMKCAARYSNPFITACDSPSTEFVFMPVPVTRTVLCVDSLLSVPRRPWLLWLTSLSSFILSFLRSSPWSKPPWSTPRHQHRRFTEWCKNADDFSFVSDSDLDRHNLQIIARTRILYLCACVKNFLIPVLTHEDPYSLSYATTDL
jgi:hypothetical protein